jgi:alpha-L-rhamnosidase
MNRLATNYQSLKNMGALLSFLVFTAIVSAGLIPVQLQCEYQTQPLAIEEPEPLLSWQLQADRRAETQSAYRILAATSPELLAPGKADLWDSGQVISSEQNHIPYAGKKLDSLQSCFWTVGVWDRDQKFSTWSEPSSWTMGILNPEDWKASFIELPAENVDEKLEWIWYPSPLFTPPGNYYFRKSFDLPEEALSAEVQISADNRFTLFVNGREAGSGASYSKFFKFDILPHLKKGANQLAILAVNDGTRDNEAGMIGIFRIKTKTILSSKSPFTPIGKPATRSSPSGPPLNLKKPMPGSRPSPAAPMA